MQKPPNVCILCGPLNIEVNIQSSSRYHNAQHCRIAPGRLLLAFLRFLIRSDFYCFQKTQLTIIQFWSGFSSANSPNDLNGYRYLFKFSSWGTSWTALFTEYGTVIK